MLNLSSIILSIVSFLLLLFPNSTMLIYEYQLRTFDTEATVVDMMNAVEKKDIQALEDMMCKNIKENVDNLSDKIGELINTIPEEIESWELLTSPHVSSNTSNGGEHLAEHGRTIYIKTANGEYEMCFVWQTINTYDADERGIRDLRVIKIIPDPERPEQKLKEVIYQITETEKFELPS